MVCRSLAEQFGMGEDGRVIDRVGLAEFLVHRRNALQPEDVGLPRGQRRRTTGLRREEVAALCHMSTDYYSRLEQERGPQPSEQMIASIAQGLHLSRDERDHLFRLAGHQPPVRNSCNEHISPGILRILDRLTDTPAEIVTELGETLRQTPLSVALLGDLSRHSGASRSSGYRWFTDPAARDLYLREDHEFYSRMYVSGLRVEGGPVCGVTPGREHGVPQPVEAARDRRHATRDQTLPAPGGRASGTPLPDPDGPVRVALALGLYGSAGERKLREARTALGYRRDPVRLTNSAYFVIDGPLH